MPAREASPLQSWKIDGDLSGSRSINEFDASECTQQRRCSRCTGPTDSHFAAAQTTLMFALFVLLPVFMGSLIYIGWRTTSLRVFDWLQFLRVPQNLFRPQIQLPNTILYSLPDGCWVFAGTSWMLLIWHKLSPWVFSVVTLALASELAQALGMMPGTFEWTDVAFYIGGFALSLTGVNYAQTLLVSSCSVGHARPRNRK